MPAEDRRCTTCGRSDRIVWQEGTLQKYTCLFCHQHFCPDCLLQHQRQAVPPRFNRQRIFTCTVCGRADFTHICPLADTGCPPGGSFTDVSRPATEDAQDFAAKWDEYDRRAAEDALSSLEASHAG